MAQENCAVSLIGEDGQIRSLAAIERDAIKHALKAAPSYSEAARYLGIGRNTLYRKIALIGGQASVESAA